MGRAIDREVQLEVRIIVGFTRGTAVRTPLAFVGDRAIVHLDFDSLRGHRFARELVEGR